jgi:dihydropteroate synthase
MGIINVTPDSFYGGSRFQSNSGILRRAEAIVNEGGKIIDIGAFSTRPGAKEITSDEEYNRLFPAVKAVKENFPGIPVSIVTYRSDIVRKIVQECGPCIINDISGGTLDAEMFKTVAGLHVPYILMHIQGTPQTMQKDPFYINVVEEVIQFLAERIQQLKLLGVNDIIVDPGFGFGKNPDHNYELMNRLESFKIFGFPILAGVSRKGMVLKTLAITPDEALNGTTVLNTLALLGGANILRVHDVKEAVEACTILKQLKSSAQEQ